MIFFFRFFFFGSTVYPLTEFAFERHKKWKQRKHHLNRSVLRKVGFFFSKTWWKRGKIIENSIYYFQTSVATQTCNWIFACVWNELCRRRKKTFVIFLRAIIVCNFGRQLFFFHITKQKMVGLHKKWSLHANYLWRVDHTALLTFQVTAPCFTW